MDLHRQAADHPHRPARQGEAHDMAPEVLADARLIAQQSAALEGWEDREDDEFVLAPIV